MIEQFDIYNHERRLNILTIFYRAIISLPGFVIILYFATIQSSAEDWINILLIMLFALLTFPFIFLHWYYYTFYITSKEIVIKSGVVSRRQRNIPIERIQNIEITQNFLQRILGIAKVLIETAGGSETEGMLEYVSKKDAEDIRYVIKSYQNKIKSEKDSDIPSFQNLEYLRKETEISEKELFSLNFKDTVINGMLRFRPVIIVFIFWLYSFLQQFLIFPAPEKFDFGQYFDFLKNLDLITLFLYIIIGIIIILISSWLADIILSINTFYNFKLTTEGNKLHTQQGLLNKRKTTIPLKKLQMLVINTNPIRKKFGYFGLTLETAGFGGKGNKPEVAVPLANEKRIIELSRNIRKFIFPEQFIPISVKTIRRALVRYLVVLFPIVLIGIFILPNILWVFILTPLLYFAAILRYQYRGYAISGDTVIIKQGFWHQKRTVIPIEKIQTLNIKETFFQRRLGLATLNIDTAATGTIGDAAIIDIDKDDAYYIMQLLSTEFHKLTHA